jgi:hypothetical protein
MNALERGPASRFEPDGRRRGGQMTLLEMRLEYERIRGTWRSRPPAEHRFDLARLQELHHSAADSVDEGTEQLAVEIDDLMGQIEHSGGGHPCAHSSSFNEPSDAM